MSNDATLTSALGVISKIGQTTNEYAKRGLERLVRLPVLVEHRDYIAAGAPPQFRPYTRFKPRLNNQDATLTPTDQNPCTTEGISPVSGDEGELDGNSSQGISVNKNSSTVQNSSSVPSDGGELDPDLFQGNSSLPANDGDSIIGTSNNPFIRPRFRTASPSLETSDTHSRPRRRPAVRYLPYTPIRAHNRRSMSPSYQQSSQASSHLRSPPVDQSSGRGGGDSTNPASLPSSPPSFLDSLAAHAPPVVPSGPPNSLLQMAMGSSHPPVVRPSLPAAVIPPPIVSPASLSLPSQEVADPTVSPVHHPPPSSQVPPADLSAGSPSPLSQMTVDSNHLIADPIDRPQLPSVVIPPPTVSPAPPSPTTRMDADPDHLAPSPPSRSSHHLPVPSITIFPPRPSASGGLSSPTTGTQMDVDRDSEPHVFQLRAGDCPHSAVSPATLGNRPTPAPSSSPGSPSLTPSPARPTRPLVLPSVLDDIISQAVSERLDAAAASFVEPTVRGIVDACIPRLTQLIDSRLASLSSGQPRGRFSKCEHNAYLRPENAEEGTDGDDESEEDVPRTSLRRRKPGPRGKMNRLHLAFRKYLRSKNVISQNAQGPLPPLASNDTVQSFNRDGMPSPTLENIALDWRCTPLKSSRWNSEVITLLSVDFHNNLKSGAYQDVVYDESTMNLPAILKLCKQKLIRTLQAYRKQMKIDATTAAERDEVVAKLSLKEDRRRRAERMTSRRHGTLARRKKIVLENRLRDREVWDDIHKIIVRLDVEGMSGDETDTPSGLTPKVLRRLEIPWINPNLSQLFKAVESYESAVRQENMAEQIGNSSLERHWEAARKDTKSRPVTGLPRNWYDDSWFQGLTAGARSMLASSKDVSIPMLTPFGG